jgi:hypothetical protein
MAAHTCEWVPKKWYGGPRELNYLTWFTFRDPKTREFIGTWEERVTTNKRFICVEDFMDWLLSAVRQSCRLNIDYGSVRIAYEVPIDMKADPHQGLLQPYDHRFELRDNRVPWHEYEDVSPVESK